MSEDFDLSKITGREPPLLTNSDYEERIVELCEEIAKLKAERQQFLKWIKEARVKHEEGCFADCEVILERIERQGEA